MSALQDEIEVYKKRQHEFEATHMGEWVIIRDRQVIGYYASFDTAADVAVDRFGAGPFLIRQIGARPVPLPASLAYTHPSA